MPSSSTPESSRFLDIAGRIERATELSAWQLGCVAIHREGVWWILALRAEAVTGAEQGDRRIDADGKVLAIETVIGFGDIQEVIQGLERGELSRIGTHQFAEPLHVAPTQGSQDWLLNERLREGSGPIVQLCRPSVAGAFLESPETREAFDAAVALGTRFEFASLGRLVLSFVHVPLEKPGAFDPVIRIPWPLLGIQLELQRGMVPIALLSVSGLDLDGLLLNVEGTSSDLRVEASTLRWIPLPEAPAGTDARRAEIPVPEGFSARAVNAIHLDFPENRIRETLPEAEGFGRFFGGLERDEEPAPERPGALVEGPVPQLEQLQVRGYRLLEDVTVDFGGLTVLIGPNQVGKTTLLKALSLMSDAAAGELSSRVSREGGFDRLVTRGWGEKAVSFVVRLGLPDQRVEYGFELERVGRVDVRVAREWLADVSDGKHTLVFEAAGGRGRMAGGVTVSAPNPRETLLSQLGPAGVPLALERVREGLSAIRIYDLRTEAISPTAQVRPDAVLEENGANLVSALYALSQTDTWGRFLDIVRLAFESLRDLKLPAVGHGQVRLVWEDANRETFDLEELSDGTLSYLAVLCALFTEGPSLVAIDEPERHLHPDALYRILGAARIVADERPVILATQSDRLLAFLDEQPEALAVVRREGRGSQVVRPDSETLARWTSDFRLDELRTEIEAWGAGE